MPVQCTSQLLQQLRGRRMALVLECQVPEVLQHCDTILRRYALRVKLCEGFRGNNVSDSALRQSGLTSAAQEQAPCLAGSPCDHFLTAPVNLKSAKTHTWTA